MSPPVGPQFEVMSLQVGPQFEVMSPTLPGRVVGHGQSLLKLNDKHVGEDVDA